MHITVDEQIKYCVSCRLTWKKNRKMYNRDYEYYPKNPDENKNCWEYFYEQLDIPHNIKDEYFRVDVDEEEEDRVYKKLNPNNEDFIFVHDIDTLLS